MKASYQSIGILLLLVLFNYKCFSQDSTRVFRRFRLDLCVGYAVPQSTGTGGKYGIIWPALEPKYAIKDQWHLGMRLEMAFLVRDLDHGASGDNIQVSSFLTTTDYYFNTQTFRPFVGIGVGRAEVPIGLDGEVDEALAIMIRFGFDSNRFHAAMEYNLVGNMDHTSSNDYLGLKAGFYMWGKRLRI